MAELAKLPKDMVFFTQITMEAGEDGEYLDAMRKANIKGALVGVEAVTPEGLKAVYKDWNKSGDALAEQLQTFKKHGVHVLGSFIFGLPTDKPATFDATVEMALKAGGNVCAVCDDDALPGDGRFWSMGEGAGEGSDAGGGCADYAVLDDSDGGEAEDVYAAPVDELGRDQGADAEGVGPVLRYSRYLAAVGLHADAAGAGGVCAAVEAVPADVCGDGDLDGQCAEKEGEDDGAVDGGADAEGVCGETDAGAGVSGVGTAAGAGAAADVDLGAGFGVGEHADGLS